MGALAAMVVFRVGNVFLAPPAVQRTTKQFTIIMTPAVAVAVGAAWMPQGAKAAEHRDNGFGVAEIATIVIPWIFVFFSYFEWESMQPPTGVAVLGDVADGPPDDQRYFRQSPETG